MGFTLKVFIFGFALVAFLDSAVAAKYGKVTCVNGSPMPDAVLLGSFLKAKCKLPTKFPISDAAAGSICRSVYVYIKAFDGKKINQENQLTAMKSVFPKENHATLVPAIIECNKKHGAQCKGEKEDPTGASFGPMFRCFEKWYNGNMCK